MRWQRVVTYVPGKTPDQIKEHFHALLHHLYRVEPGRFELPSYSYDSATVMVEANDSLPEKTTPVQKKKMWTWTEKEHRLFLIGLEKDGKGDWKSISRNVVKSKTATQIASHAQKYFIRQGFPKEQRKRTSIHDITIIKDIALGDQLHSPNVPMQEPQAQQILQSCFHPAPNIPVQQIHTTEIMKNMVHAPSAPMQQLKEQQQDQETMQNWVYPPYIPRHQLHAMQQAPEILKNLVYAPNIPLQQLQEPQSWVLNVPTQQNQ
ncbi:transcription factor SRM1-like [Gastrolobium bilobum]|uniref:transcription factor SRM1-like n=1 Tax=Gastrolobium bilobum TaxID=150636 RepID=UPI002AB13B79|nr:transcription factor SRM1-like [Gastrolobium bilobum]